MRVPGAASYRGDLRDHLACEPVVAQTTYGTWLVSDELTYDPATDVTRVTFRHATTSEVEAQG